MGKRKSQAKIHRDTEKQRDSKTSKRHIVRNNRGVPVSVQIKWKVNGEWGHTTTHKVIKKSPFISKIAWKVRQALPTPLTPTLWLTRGPSPAQGLRTRTRSYPIRDVFQAVGYSCQLVTLIISETWRSQEKKRVAGLTPDLISKILTTKKK